MWQQILKLILTRKFFILFDVSRNTISFLCYSYILLLNLSEKVNRCLKYQGNTKRKFISEQIHLESQL